MRRRCLSRRWLSNGSPWPSCSLWTLRLDEIALPLTCTLLLASYVMPGTWVVVLALMATASCVLAESERRSDNAARKGRYQRLFPPKPTSLEPKEATAARARSLGLFRF